MHTVVYAEEERQRNATAIALAATGADFWDTP
jgi:hypothetical protein